MFTCMIDMEDGSISMPIIMMGRGNLMILLLASRMRMRIGDHEAARVRTSFKESTEGQGNYLILLTHKARRGLLKQSPIIS